MGTRDRTRPDESRKAGYITAAGYRRLEEEAAKLWNEVRPEVTAALQAAAAEGDRSENAEYIYRKRQLAEIDRRLRFLGNRLDALTRVDGRPADDGRVYFGCTAVLETDTGEFLRYRIVGADETNADRAEISMDSPLGRALLGKKLDDEVTVRRPKGDLNCTIVEILVDPPDETIR